MDAVWGHHRLTRSYSVPMTLGLLERPRSGLYKRSGPTPTSHPTNTIHTVALGVAPKVGDMIVLVQSSGATVRLINPGAPWTRLNNGTGTVQILYKIADGTEGTSLVLTTNVATGVAVYNSYVFKGAASIEMSRLNFSANPPNLAPSGGLLDYYWLCGFSHTTTGATVTSYPANYFDGLHTVNSNVAVVTCERGLLLAASEDPGTFSTNLTPSTVFTAAIQPA